jgi:hypothetical protein
MGVKNLSQSVLFLLLPDSRTETRRRFQLSQSVWHGHCFPSSREENMEEQERLMQDAIDQAYRHTLELQSICASAGAEFSAGQDQEGMAHLRHILDGIGCIAQAIHVTTDVQRTRGVQIDLTHLPEVLEPLVEALENRDYTALGDLVHYEVEPVLSEWGERLAGLSSESGTAVQG